MKKLSRRESLRPPSPYSRFVIFSGAAVAAGLGGDMPLLLGITVMTAALVFGGNLTADLLYGVIDPRIRKGAAKR